MESISIDVIPHHLNSDTATLRLKGFIYANTLAHLDKTTQSVLDSDRKKLVFDLSEATYVSSGGWALISTLFRRIQGAGGGLVLAGMKPEVYDSFELLEYDKVLRSFPNVDSALKEGFGNATGQVTK